MLDKFKHLEIIVFLGVLIGALAGFFYCEESLILRIVSLILALWAVFYTLKIEKSKTVSSKYEFLSLITAYLGVFTAYSLLFLVNLPLYMSMLMVLVVILSITWAMFSSDKIQQHISRPIYLTLIFILGLVILELFLALYFLSIEIAAKTLIIALVYYFLINLVYLYANSMLRLKKVIGLLIISLIIVTAVVLSMYFG